MRHPRLLALLCPLLLSGCGGSKSAEPKIAASETPQQGAMPFAELPTLFRNQKPALSTTALHYLPDTTFAGVVLKSPASVASAIESTSIFREYADFYQDVANEFALPSGAHALEVESWGALGVDLQQPAGAAFWVQQGPVGAFFVSLSAPDLFLQAMAESAQSMGLPAPQQGQLASAQVIRFGPDAELAFVSRAQTGFLVIADRADDLSLAVQTLAGVGNTKSLAESGRVARAFADLDYGEDLAGFVAFDSIAERIEADLRERQGDDWYTEEINRLEASIELAKTEQRTQAEIDNLEKEVEARLIEHNRYQLRRSGEARLNADIMHPLGTVAFGVDLDGQDTRVRLHLQADKDSLPAGLLARSSKALALPARLTEAPLFLLAAQVSSEAANRFFDLILQSEGETRSTLAASLRSETGVELTQVLPLFEGEISMAFTFNQHIFQGARGARAFLDALGLHLLFELNDQEAAKALLAKATGSAALNRYAVERGGQTILEIPSFNRRKLRVQILEGRLELRSIGAPIEQFAWTERESALLNSHDNAAVMLIDPLLLGWSVFGSSYGRYSDMEGTSKSAAQSAAVEARLAEIAKEELRLQRREHALRSEQMTRDVGSVGRLLMVARPQATGFALLASLRSQSASLGRAFQRLSEALNPEIESARLGKSSALEEIQQQIETLDKERWRLVMETSP